MNEKDIGLVRAIVLSHYKHVPLDIDDMISAGCIGFLKAKEKFDEQYKVQLNTYASHYIRGEITDLIDKEVRHASRYTTLDPEVIKDRNITDDSTMFDKIDVDLINKYLVRLKPREREVIISYYLRDVNLEDIAHKLGVSHQRVAQIRDEGMKKLKVELGVLDA